MAERKPRFMMGGQQFSQEFAEDVDLLADHDIAIVSASQFSGENLQVADTVMINGDSRPRCEYPEFELIAKRRDLIMKTLGRMSTAGSVCIYCSRRLRVEERHIEDPYEESHGWPTLHALIRLERCVRCKFWRLNELRTATSDVRAMLYDSHTLTTAMSKLRSFDQVAPEGTLAEIAQWFRRHPSLYQSVDPIYLEKLVGRVFASSGRFAEVRHVGRPDDGGVDLVLVEDDTSTWLVQVKRREDGKASESVSTVRNLLGALVLKDSRLGIVVSTADHFTYRAREATRHASRVGYRVELVDRQLLDAMLARALPAEPWGRIMQSLQAEREAWINPESW